MDPGLLPHLLMLVAAVHSTDAAPRRSAPHSQPRSPQALSPALGQGPHRLRVERSPSLPALRVGVIWRGFASGSRVIRPADLRDSQRLPTRPDSAPARPRRSQNPGGRGCQLGTCQLHNLASLLYRIGAKSGKEESSGAADPRGYGRRRR